MMSSAYRGNSALSGSSWAAVRHYLNRRDHEWLSPGSGGQKNYMPVISAHFRSFSATAGHFQPLPPIFAIWCPDRLAVSGDLKIGTAFNTAFRLEIRHEAWQEPSVIKTRLSWLACSIHGQGTAMRAPPTRRSFPAWIARVVQYGFRRLPASRRESCCRFPGDKQYCSKWTRAGSLSA